jgi:hypothetical protein
MTEKTEPGSPPFPGMDPYLEAPDVWPDFHDRLAATLSAMLNEQLPAPYYARLQKRPELGIALGTGLPQHIIPDVTSLRRALSEARSAYEASAAASVDTPERPRDQPTPGIEVRVDVAPFQHHFVEILDAERGHKLVVCQA